MLTPSSTLLGRQRRKLCDKKKLTIIIATKLTHDTKFGTWKFGELTLYFDQSAGGLQRKQKNIPKEIFTGIDVGAARYVRFVVVKRARPEARGGVTIVGACLGTTD